MALKRFLLNKIHEGYLNLAILSLNEVGESHHSGSTVLIHPKRVAEAQERIKAFRRSLSSYLAVKPEEKEEKLYRIQISLFTIEKG